MTENKRFTSDIHRIFDNDEEIACADTMDDAEILVDLLNEQEEQLNRIKKLCKDNKIPICLTAHIPVNCEHYHACFENHTENSVSFGKSKIANKILKIIKGDCNE